MAIESLITDHLDLWTAAVRPKSSAGRGSNSKLELTGIKKLRELILELAVRGKLVPQDPNDEPASVLLERIAAEKARLVKEGKIKKSKALPEIGEDEKPFELPEGWEWRRLPDICDYYPGKTPLTKNPIYWDGQDIGIPWVSISDMRHCGVVNITNKKITARAVEDVFKRSPTPAGTILMSFKLTVGKISYLGFDAYHNEAILSIYPSHGISKEFLFHFLPNIALCGNTKSAIMGNTLNSESLSMLKIPIPPEDEQHRIVAKVDELMALCDQLEQQSEAQLAAHQKLVEALLATLTDSADANELAKNWTRLSTHFDTLFTTEASIDALKQTILQLAVMGKLVPQDPSDEPASGLLERIATEKARLVKEKKIKKEKPLPAISEDEKPFELPQEWEWVKFDYIAKNEKNALKAGPFGSALKKDMYVASGYKIYGQEQVISGNEDFGDYFIDEEKYRSLESCKVQAGDILISLVGTIGKVLILSDKAARGIMNPRLVKISLFSDIDRKYISIVLGSQLVQNELYRKSHGSTMNVLNLGLLRELVFPLPPVKEQSKIVNKVESLLAVCDQLKGYLQTSRQTQLALAGSLVEGALS